jgi:SAM-dependent methyltransferase
MMELDQTRFKLKDGIWYAANQADISYPESGNSASFLVEEQSWWFTNRNALIVGLVKKYSKGKVFWDIGGGNGFVSKGIQDAGEEVILLEPGPAGAVNARNRGIKNVICATLENGQMAPGSIHAAGMFDVIEHIEDDAAFVAHVAEAMAPNGMVFITVPAYQFLWSADDTFAGHYRRYTLRKLNRLLSHAGFERVSSSYFYSLLVFPIFIARTFLQRIRKADVSSMADKNKVQSEHTAPGMLNKLLHALWRIERAFILRGIQIPFGASCVVVYRKK